MFKSGQYSEDVAGEEFLPPVAPRLEAVIGCELHACVVGCEGFLLPEEKRPRRLLRAVRELRDGEELPF